MPCKDLEELKEKFIGLTIESIDADLNHSDEIYTLKIKLSDGSELQLEPSHDSNGGRKIKTEIIN
jgi:hypothetical protein